MVSLDNITRIMAEGLLLDPAADVVDRGVGELGHVEVVQHKHGVGQANLGVGERRPVGSGRVESSDTDPGPPLRGLRRQQALSALLERPSMTSSGRRRTRPTITVT